MMITNKEALNLQALQDHCKECTDRWILLGMSPHCKNCETFSIIKKLEEKDRKPTT